MSDQIDRAPSFVPTRRFALRVAGLHDSIEGVVAALWERTERRAPVAPELMVRTVHLLDGARRTLARHALGAEVPPLAATPPVPPGELLVRLERARMALRALYEGLEGEAVATPRRRRPLRTYPRPR